jgi:hypothetical protein
MASFPTLLNSGGNLKYFYITIVLVLSSGPLEEPVTEVLKLAH